MDSFSPALCLQAPLLISVVYYLGMPTAVENFRELDWLPGANDAEAKGLSQIV
jgi:hypothetical protein